MDLLKDYNTRNAVLSLSFVGKDRSEDNSNRAERAQVFRDGVSSSIDRFLRQIVFVFSISDSRERNNSNKATGEADLTHCGLYLSPGRSNLPTEGRSSLVMRLKQHFNCRESISRVSLCFTSVNLSLLTTFFRSNSRATLIWFFRRLSSIALCATKFPSAWFFLLDFFGYNYLHPRGRSPMGKQRAEMRVSNCTYSSLAIRLSLESSYNRRKSTRGDQVSRAFSTRSVARE